MNMQQKNKTKHGLVQLREKKLNRFVRALNILKNGSTGAQEGSSAPQSYEQRKAMELEVERMRSRAIEHTRRNQRIF